MNREGKSFVKSGTVQLLLAIASVACTILAVYITARLAPLAQNIAVIAANLKSHEQLNQVQFNYIQQQLTSIQNHFNIPVPVPTPLTQGHLQTSGMGN